MPDEKHDVHPPPGLVALSAFSEFAVTSRIFASSKRSCDRPLHGHVGRCCLQCSVSLRC